MGGGDVVGEQLGAGAGGGVGCWALLMLDGLSWLLGALAVCLLELMDEKYICMVVWERRRRDLEGRAVRSMGIVSWDPLLGATGAVCC